jgi:hypothetical protein
MTAKNILNSGGGSGSKNKTLVTLQSVLAELESWRKNKKFSSEPIPQIIKEQIYHLVTSKQYKPIQIIKQLRISSSKIKSIESDIKTYFAEKSKKEAEATFKSVPPEPPNLDLQLLPFELLPKNNTTKNPKNTDLNCQSNNNNSKSSSDNIVINKGSGDNLYLPTNLSENVIYKIIQLFLCSK